MHYGNAAENRLVHPGEGAKHPENVQEDFREENDV